MFCTVLYGVWVDNSAQKRKKRHRLPCRKCMNTPKRRTSGTDKVPAVAWTRPQWTARPTRCAPRCGGPGPGCGPRWPRAGAAGYAAARCWPRRPRCCGRPAAACCSTRRVWRAQCATSVTWGTHPNVGLTVHLSVTRAGSACHSVRACCHAYYYVCCYACYSNVTYYMAPWLPRAA